MPPAAPSFPDGMPNHAPRKRLFASVPPSKLRKPGPKKIEFSDVRLARKLRPAESSDVDLGCPTPKRRKGKGKGAAVEKRRRGSDTSGLDGDYNIALSGEEDSEEIDYIDYSSDEGERSAEDSPDDDDVPAGLRQKKKFYIVQNDGRPAELYRTDLIHRLRNGEDSSEDSDEESGPGNGFIRLTDRWREEWNHGVQVPMNAKNLPLFETAPNSLAPVEKPKFHMPVKYIGIRAEGSSSSYVDPTTHSITEMPQRRLYEGDRMDELWLQHVNKARAHMNKPAIAMDTFLTIMDSLEVKCYERIHQLLLAPLHSPDARIDEVDEEAACDICRSSECEAEDAMVFCDGCNMCVHMSCYGLAELPAEEWICMKCSLCYGTSPACLLCPTTGGALKCTKKMEDNKRRWAHVVCALWIPECRFGDAELREPITNIEEIPDERWQLKCSICDTRQGACIQCTVPSCRTPFHVTCALRSGLEMRIEQDPDPETDIVRFISLCPRHRTAQPFTDAATSSQSASDEETSDVKENKELRRLEDTFYLRVDYEVVARRLNIDLLVVSDVYEYWKLKRTNSGCKPLLRNPQDEIKLSVERSAPTLSLPSPTSGKIRHSSATRPMQWSSQAGRVRKSLDIGRNLLYMVHKRTKERHLLLATEWSVMRNIWQQTMVPTPLSGRVIDQLTEVVQSVMRPEDLDKATCMEDEGRASMVPDRRMSLVPTSSQTRRESTRRTRTSLPMANQKKPLPKNVDLARVKMEPLDQTVTKTPPTRGRPARVKMEPLDRIVAKTATRGRPSRAVKMEPLEGLETGNRAVSTRGRSVRVKMEPIEVEDSPRVTRAGTVLPDPFPPSPSALSTSASLVPPPSSPSKMRSIENVPSTSGASLVRLAVNAKDDSKLGLLVPPPKKRIFSGKSVRFDSPFALADRLASLVPSRPSRRSADQLLLDSSPKEGPASIKTPPSSNTRRGTRTSTPGSQRPSTKRLSLPPLPPRRKSSRLSLL